MAEGFLAYHGGNILIADDLHTLVEHVVNLMRIRDRRDSFSANAARPATYHYDWRMTMFKFLHLIQQAPAG